MTFTVEDGTGVSGANAYITVAYADAYHLERGNGGWTGTDTTREQAIVRATDYIESRFGQRFRGSLEFTDPLQPLSWPRLYAYDNNGQLLEDIPAQLQRATAEYALRALTQALMPDLPYDDNGFVKVQTLRRVGPLEAQYKIVQVPTLKRPYPVADALLRPLLTSSSGVYR